MRLAVQRAMLEQEDVDIRSMMARMNRALARMEGRMALLEHKEQEVSQVEHTIERDFDRVRRKDLALHSVIDKLGTTLSRLESRLEGLERQAHEKRRD